MTALQDLLQQADFYKEKITSFEPPKKEEQKSLDALDDEYVATSFGAAYKFMLESAKQPDMNITEETFRKLHELCYQNVDASQAGQYRTASASLPGTGYVPPAHEEIPRFMKHLADQIHSSRSTLHPIELAAMAHKRLVDIHPFSKGNTRIAMLLMNLILVNSGYPLTSVPPALREDYANALSASRQQKDMDPFSRLIAQCVIQAEQDYCQSLG